MTSDYDGTSHSLVQNGREDKAKSKYLPCWDVSNYRLHGRVPGIQTNKFFFKTFVKIILKVTLLTNDQGM